MHPAGFDEEDAGKEISWGTGLTNVQITQQDFSTYDIKALTYSEGQMDRTRRGIMGVLFQPHPIPPSPSSKIRHET